MELALEATLLVSAKPVSEIAIQQRAYAVDLALQMFAQFTLQLRLEGLGRKRASIPTKQLFANAKDRPECRSLGYVLWLGRSMQVKLTGKLVAERLWWTLEQPLKPLEPNAAPCPVGTEIATRYRF